LLDQAALTLLYRHFLPIVYRYALLRIGHVDYAEDVTSETFTTLVANIASVRATDELGFTGWVLGIARNKVLRHFRHQRTHAAAPLDTQIEPGASERFQMLTEASQDDPLAIVLARESWAEVVVALERLTDDQRDVVLYRCLLGYNTEQVSQMLDKPATAIRALQHRGLTSLARHLGISDWRPADRRQGGPAHPGEGSKRHAP
jgi:RNA polymerase sigma-70 factor (ECF subfamily)